MCCIIVSEVVIIKKFISVILVLFGMLTVIANAKPDEYSGFQIPVDVEINGAIVKCPQKGFVEDGTTYIPVRAFSNAINAYIDWDSTLNVAKVLSDGVSFAFYENGACYCNDVLELGATTKTYDGTMYVPVRFICDKLDFEIIWNDMYFCADILAPGVEVNAEFVEKSYDKADLLMLARLVYLESKSESLSAKIGVADTVVNRVKSPLYPNTVQGAIMDTKYSVQYPPAHTDKMNVTPPAECMIAAKCALSGVNLVRNSVSFVNKNQFATSWVANNMKHYNTIGNLGFFEN